MARTIVSSPHHKIIKFLLIICDVGDPEVFGTNEGLAAALREAIGLPEDSLEFTLPAIYKDGGTRMGVW